MNPTPINFYRSFFGSRFARHFRRPSDFKISRIQFTITKPRHVCQHVDKNSGFLPCYVSIYDYYTVDHLKDNEQANIIFDRAYFDFDISNTYIKNIKKNLTELRSHGLDYMVSEQDELKLQLKECIINNKVAKPAIDEGKLFAKIFKESFGKYPALFFSGFKGCHVYCFYEPTKLINPNKTIEYFASRTKNVYNLQTMDLSVNKSALSRVARIPYSKHQLTGLSVIPFKITDSYEDIISRSLNPIVEPFSIENHYTQFNGHLQNIDHTLEDNRQIKSAESATKIKCHPNSYNSYDGVDHLSFFNDFLGEPVSKYLDKEYVMYCCPFTDHNDNKPSFRVFKTGYNCYGCSRKGNYWQFLKDYYNWDDIQVKHYLNSKSY